MTKLIVSSDSHIHDHKAFSDGVGRENSRLQQTLKVTRDSLEKARELGAVWVHGGDIIHTTGFSKHPITSVVIELFEEYPDVPKVMVWGNHDSRGRGGVVRIEDTFQYVLSKSVDNLHILNNSSVEIQGVKFYGCGAQPDRSLYQYEEADVGIYHDFVKGAKLPSGITLSDGIPQEDLYKHYRLSIVGDIHVPHLQEKDGRYVMIPGSPEAHTFGDVGERGWYIVDINDTIEIESVTSDSPLFITVEDVSEIKQDGNFYKIVGNPPQERLDNVKYVSSAPDVVESRNLLSIKDGIESMLQKWMEVTPPDGDNDNYLSTAKELVAEQDIIVPQNHKLLSVSGTNFCSYEEFSYTINDGVTLVVGAGDVYSSNGCLVGSTKIDIPRNFRDNPEGVPISELVGKQPLVYTYDTEKNKFVVAKAAKVWKTEKNAPVYRLTYSIPSVVQVGEFNCHEELIGTYNHPVLTMDGVYVPLGKLQPGDRIRPLRRRNRDSKYTCVVQPDGSLSLDHRLVGDFISNGTLKGPKEEHVHHIDGDTFNNSPDNLEIMSVSEHLALHAKDNPPTYDEHPRGMLGKNHKEAVKAQISETMKKRWEEDREERLKSARKASAKYWATKDRPWTNKELLYDLYVTQKFSTVQIGKQLNTSDGTIGIWLKRHGIPVRSSGESLKIRNENHRVESVEFIGYEDVYDMHVPHYNNFVANNIVVHNSGKSSLFEAVYWCLFGKTTKGLGADDVIRWGEKKASVEVEILLSSGKTLRIVRERTPTLKLSAFIAGEEVGGDTNRDLEVKILGLLGLNEKLFRSLAYFSQEDVVLLSRASDAEIKDIISDLAGLSGFQEASSAAAKKASESENTIEKQKINLANKKDELSHNKERLGEIDSNIEAFETSREANIAQYEKRLSELQLEARQVKERDLSGLKDKAERLIDRAKARASDIFNQVYSEVLEKKTTQTEQELSEKEGELSEYSTEETVSDLESAITEIEEKVGKCNSKEAEVTAARSKVITEKNNLGYELKQIEKRLAKYDEGVCPECGQPLGASSEDKTEELTKKKKELSQKIAALSDKEEKVTEYLNKLSTKKQQLTESLNEKKSLLRRAQKQEALEREIATLRETAEKANQSEAKIIATNKKEAYEKERSVLIRDRAKRARSWLDAQITKYDDLISRAEKQHEDEVNRENPHVAYKEKIEQQIADLETKQQKLSEEIKAVTNQVAVYQYWNKGFGKSGIQSLLMDEIAGAFNSVRGKIFPVLTNGYYDVQLSTLSQTKAGELRERIAFLVFDQGQEVPYEALSGGQRRRVDLGVLLTMTAAVCQSYGIQGLLGILSLDEVTSYLDEDGSEALAQTLNEYVDFAVPSIYLISHDPNLQALFSQVMEVEMKDGVSRIK